jgi:predicted transposase/invertase (TIGR01784 family)
MAYVTSFERRARKEGLQQGERLKALVIAKKMHGKGFDIKFIQEMTGLSDQELLQLEDSAEALA